MKKYNCSPQAAVGYAIQSRLIELLSKIERDFIYRSVDRFIPDTHTGSFHAKLIRVDLRFIGINKVFYLYAPPNDAGLSRDLATFGIREPLHVKWLWRVVEVTKPCILDIGSNIGYFPVIELEAGAKHVIAVEPVPTAFNYLKLNLAKYRDKTTLLNIAVVEDDREYVKMKVPTEKSGLKLNNAAVSEDGEIIVKARNINDLVREYKPHMIRMDIEGYEWKLLRTLDDNNLAIIDIETHDVPDRREIVESLINLSTLGFKKAIVLLPIHTIPHLYQAITALLRLEIDQALELLMLDFKSEITVYCISINDAIKNIHRIVGKHVILLRT